MMVVSPSIASGDVLYVASELDYIDKYYDNLHIDVEDGVAVGGISFGMKMTKKICEYSKSKEKTLHLEVLNPLDYLEDISKLQLDVVFLQISHIKNAMEIINKYKEKGVNVGINLCDEDFGRPDWDEILACSKWFLINTTAHYDPEQIYMPQMEKFALELSEDKEKKIWIDGCVTYETYQRLKDSNIYCAVIGRAVFNDKEKAVEQFCK